MLRDSVLLPPKSGDRFEDIATEALRAVWDDPLAVRYGRSGQGQQGVDVVGHPKYLGGGLAVAQCKARKLTIRLIEADLLKAQEFEHTFGEYIVVTSMSRDAKLMSDVLHLKDKYAFQVRILFWEDVLDRLSDAALERYFGRPQAERPPQAPKPKPWTNHELIMKAEVQSKLLRPDPEPGLGGKFLISDGTIRNWKNPSLDDGEYLRIDLLDVYDRGLVVGTRMNYAGIVREDGTWDVCHKNYTVPGRQWFPCKGYLPYKVMTEIDPGPCRYGYHPHIYCKWIFGGRPYERVEYIGRVGGEYVVLTDEKRVAIFPEQFRL